MSWNHSFLDSELPFMKTYKDGIISEELNVFFENIYYHTFSSIVSILGVATNGLNIRAFAVIGKEDGITVSLLALSISDFGYSLTSLIMLINFFFRQIQNTFNFFFVGDPYIINGFVNQINTAFLVMTVMNTTYLAVARCMCVIKPLHFSNTFTRSRSIAIHICIAIVGIGGYIPLMTQMGAKRVFDHETNQTRYVSWHSSHRGDVEAVVFLIFDVIVNFSVQIVLIICGFIMAASLRKSVQFRRSTKTETNPEADRQNHNKLTGKELQVFHQLFLITSIYMICPLPRLACACYTLIEPEFDVGKRLHYLNFLVSRVRRAFDGFNATTTFFVYYSYNTRFREYLRGRKGIN